MVTWAVSDSHLGTDWQTHATGSFADETPPHEYGPKTAVINHWARVIFKRQIKKKEGFLLALKIIKH